MFNDRLKIGVKCKEEEERDLMEDNALAQVLGKDEQKKQIEIRRYGIKP